MTPTLSQIEAEIAETRNQMAALKKSSGSADGLQSRVAEKEAALAKAAKAKEGAEKSASATSSLVEGAQKDCEKVTKDGEKSCGKLESQVSVASQRHAAAEQELADLAQAAAAKKQDLTALSAQLEEERAEGLAQFQTELEEFHASVADTAASLKTRVEALSGEHLSLSSEYCSARESLEKAESELEETLALVAAKRAKIEAQKTDAAKKLKRAIDDRDFLAKELERVQTESDRKLEQLNGLGLEDLLNKLKEELVTQKQEAKVLEKASTVSEVELKAITDAYEKASLGCDVAEAEAASIKGKIDAECKEYREKAVALEKEIASLQTQFIELENLEWELNHKYSQQIELEVSKAASSPSAGAKKKKKGKKEQETSAEAQQAQEETKKLAEVSAALEKEKKEAAKLEARIAYLEKGLKTAKTNKKKAEKLQGTEHKKQCVKNSAQSFVADDAGDTSPRGMIAKAAVHQDSFSNFVAVFFSVIACLPGMKHIIPEQTKTKKSVFCVCAASFLMVVLASMNASR